MRRRCGGDRGRARGVPGVLTGPFPGGLGAGRHPSTAGPPSPRHARQVRGVWTGNRQEGGSMRRIIGATLLTLGALGALGALGCAEEAGDTSTATTAPDESAPA